LERGLLHEWDRFANPGLMRHNENVINTEYRVGWHKPRRKTQEQIRRWV
jgi:hypothetical protein